MPEVVISSAQYIYLSLSDNHSWTVDCSNSYKRERKETDTPALFITQIHNPRKAPAHK